MEGLIMYVRIVWVLFAVSGMVLTSSAQDSGNGRGIRGRMTSERFVESDGPVTSEQVLACEVNDDCNDLDVCTYDACGDDAQCSSTPKVRYGDVNGDEVVSMFDIFCVLDLIGGVDPPIGGDTCSPANADIHPCEPNGVVSILDALAILDNIGGFDPCCSPGGCCLPDGFCVDVDSGRKCEALGGEFGRNCDERECPAP
jgi:hypothetical protein